LARGQVVKKQRPRHASQPRKETRNLLRIAGLPAVSALFATAPERVERLFFDERAAPLLGSFCAVLARAHKPYRLVGAAELERVAGTVLHGGVVALAQPRPVAILDVAEAARWAHDGDLLLLLDGIGNPHNLGAIARTAAFFGLPRLVLSDHAEQAGPSDAAYRVAEGGLEHLALYRAPRFAQTLKELGRSYRVIGTAASKGTPLDALKPDDRPVALVLGNEEEGLPRATRAACDEVVTIRGSGRVQSLNVSASAAILVHALVRPTPHPSPLPEGERGLTGGVSDMPLVGQGGGRAKRGSVRR
jgi:RNA methyltransferase, TrmH family